MTYCSAAAHKAPSACTQCLTCPTISHPLSLVGCVFWDISSLPLALASWWSGAWPSARTAEPADALFLVVVV